MIMIGEMYPAIYSSPDNDKISVQSFLFGHRIKPQQTLYEYAIEFLIVAFARKKIVLNDNSEIIFHDMFPIDNRFENNIISYIPKLNMGLKRFLFFENSRIDTKAEIDKEAYDKCVELIKKLIDVSDSNYKKDNCIFILQNLLYGFSVENVGRSWFNKVLLPVSPEVLFPESLATKESRNKVELKDAYELDHSFSIDRYTYMCRGGEIYYLHLLHAINSYPEKKKDIESGFNRMINSIPEITEISNLIQSLWVKSMEIPDDALYIEKRLGAIPVGFKCRDNNTLDELKNFLACKMNPMEKINLFSYGLILQMLRMMYNVVAVNSDNKHIAWFLDMSEINDREHNEIKKLSVNSYIKNEEAIIKYLNYGIEYYFGDKTTKEKEEKFSKAENDTYKLFRKLSKKIGILVPLTGPNMRLTLSEEIIKFLVMSFIPPGKKITYDQFLDMMYEHFNMIVSKEHYDKASMKGFVEINKNTGFLSRNKSDFAQKLKACGFLRDLSDATSIVENPYESEI